ncbi:MAG: hypothetical protein UV68_C0046G0002 [Candidatus Collierbacteria bacterium GW2011_GWC2_43_12]|uniref:DUF3800 domain-containing protein n=1 Tax=Candidatus Collierbacteria bacterium GW2011_GWC2_43_12 TaxID=1618390 RepID=A0A0G1G0A5_9BACT|nr:MAG: hypothetical protein UV68_C0046G0002 [Candidatus Collierbacteria bacterium GW2011_GWC2_43_12]
MDDTLFVFIDESGNLDFSENGSRYYLFTAVSTTKPLDNRVLLHELKYKILCDNHDLEYFHATEDTQAVRNEFFSIVKSCSDFSVDSIIAQKNKTHPSLYQSTYEKKGKMITRTTGDEFYRINCQTLLQYIFRRHNATKLNRIVVILSSIFTNDRNRAIVKALKTYLKTYTKLPFNIYFHDGRADINCQIADYCCWAIAVKWERNELRPIAEIQSKVKSEFEIFQKGGTIFYPYTK